MKSNVVKVVLIALLMGVVSITSILIWQYSADSEQEKVTTESTEKEVEGKKLVVEPVVKNLHHPWDVKETEDGVLYLTQRQSGLYKYTDQLSEIYLPEDLYTAGEGGMLGFDLSPDFSKSREVYACFNSKDDEENIQVLVAKLTLDENFSTVSDREDIITGIPSAESGRHSGCRVLFDRQNDDVLWITTGDSADGTVPQDPKSLGGKVLRVDREGKGVEGNLNEPFDSRIFSYGHRNVQGITLFNEYQDEFGYGFTAEHGPDVDDEINPLIKGNFGWDPNQPYDESVPMTDLDKFPDAVESVWSSGDRTIAACGVEYVENGPFKGDLLQAALSDRYILRFEVGEDGKLDKKEEVINEYGRIRQIYESENGRIFFTTDNGGDDIVGEIRFE